MARTSRRPLPAPLPANLGPVLEFMRALWALDHALGARHREISLRFGVTGSQRLVVRIVGQTPGISAGQIARVLHVHPSTLTPTLQALVGRRLVRRAADSRDRRRAVLWLTKRGERVDHASAGLVDAAVRAALARVTAAEAFAARRVLHAVAAAVGGKDPAAALEQGTREAAARPRARVRARSAAARQGSAGAAAGDVAAPAPAERVRDDGVCAADAPDAAAAHGRG